jgi:hypothetical protein
MPKTHQNQHPHCVIPDRTFFIHLLRYTDINLDDHTAGYSGRETMYIVMIVSPFQSCQVQYDKQFVMRCRTSPCSMWERNTVCVCSSQLLFHLFSTRESQGQCF